MLPHHNRQKAHTCTLEIPHTIKFTPYYIYSCPSPLSVRVYTLTVFSVPWSVVSHQEKNLVCAKSSPTNKETHTRNSFSFRRPSSFIPITRENRRRKKNMKHFIHHRSALFFPSLIFFFCLVATCFFCRRECKENINMLQKYRNT